MSKLVRKNLMLDAEALGALARTRGQSESRVVRDLVEQALGFAEMADALTELSELVQKEGAFADFEVLFPALEAEEGDARPVRKVADRPAQPYR